MDCFTKMITCYVHSITIVYFQKSLQITAFMNKQTAHALNHFDVESVWRS